MSSNQKSIFHISDTHVWSSGAAAQGAAARGNKQGGMGTWQRLEETKHICKSIAARFDPKDVVVLITGDIVEGGNFDSTRAMEYRNAEEALQPIVRKGFDIQLVPGNHDYGPFGNFYSQDARRRYLNLHKRICKDETTFPYRKEYGVWRLFLLDSVAHQGRPGPFARGKLGPAQLSWLRASLESDAKPTVIAFHHHPLMRTIKGKIFLAIDDAEDFWSVIKSFPNIPITVCCGHKHVEDHQFVRSGKFRAVAAGQSTQNIGGIIVDPFQENTTRVNLRNIVAAGERTLTDQVRVHGRLRPSKERNDINNRRMEQGCIVKSVNLVRLNSRNQVIDGPKRRINVGNLGLAGVQINQDAVGTNSLRVQIVSWNQLATDLRYRVVYRVQQSGGATCKL